MLKDRNAQFRLYQLYSKAMLNTANRILNNQGDAEDAMQEGFLSAFTSISRYDYSVPFGTWLKKIVINKSLDIYRKKSRLVFTEGLDGVTDENEGSFSDNFNNSSAKNEIIRVINEALYNLPDGYRIVFSLYMLEGYDHDEISGILGIKASASRSQLARAKKLLQRKLSENSSINKYRSSYG